MSFEVGQVIIDRFQITQILPECAQLLRFQAKDRSTDQLVEIITPSNSARLRPNATPFFLSSHKHQTQPSAIWIGESESRSIAVYPYPLTPLTAIPKLGHEEGAQFARYALSELKQNADAFSEGLRLSDLCVDAQNQIVLRPSGITPKESNIKIDMAATSGTPLQKSLYGLGILLFGMLSTPIKAATPSEREQIRQNPPRLKLQRPDIPEELDQLIAQLLHPDPEKRELSLEKSHPVDPILLPQKESETASKPTSTGTIQFPEVQRDLSLPTWLIFCKEKTLPINIARRIAAISQLDPKGITTNSHLLPLCGADTESEANRKADLIRKSGIDVEVRHKRSGINPFVVFGITLFLSALSLLSIFGLGLPGIALAAIIFLVGTLVSASIGVRGNGKNQKLHRAWNELLSPRGVDQSILQGRASTQSARRAIMSSPLPSLAKIDLYESLDEMDDILDDHHESNTALPSTLLEDIRSASMELELAVQDQSTEHVGLAQKTKAKTALVQELSKQMRSL
ncbi:MAG: hypothetical protein VX278_11040 [Myxococcota bacterium]|nr:hypothetical protein [Myxococcota bacterium]